MTKALVLFSVLLCLSCTACSISPSIDPFGNGRIISNELIQIKPDPPQPCFSLLDWFNWIFYLD